MKKALSALIALFIVFLHIGSAPAQAAAADYNFDVYMQLDGIEGETPVKGFEKWIELSSVDFGMIGSAFIGADGGGIGAGKMEFNNLKIAKQFDKSSIPLMMKALQGKPIPKGKIVFLAQTGKGNLTTVLQLEFEKILPVSYNFQDTEETIELAFTKIKWSYWPIDSKGNPSSTPITGTWDLTSNSED